jgi:glycosyltransferase involved in cell wall biosynthesis
MRNQKIILIVASGNSQIGEVSPFISEQAKSIESLGYGIEFFLIKGKGLSSYLGHVFGLLYRVWCKPRPYLIHAHFVWSGLVAVLQLRVPVIVTYHGCDLNVPMLRRISNNLVRPLSRHSIVVNKEMLPYLSGKNKSWIPCGIDVKLFVPYPKSTARKELGLPRDRQIVLFASSFNRIEKNYALAEQAVNELNANVDLIEFSGYTRKKSAYLYSAVDCLLLTSIREGSPQVIKEAMACGCPIVSTDVGDISWLLKKTTQTRIVSFKPKDVALGLSEILGSGLRSNGRERVIELGLDLDSIANRIDNVYKVVKS